MSSAESHPGAPRGGPAARRARRAASGRPALLIFIVVLLCTIGFVQAVLLFPLIFGPAEREAPTVGDVNLPERSVRIFRTAGEPELILKERLDLPEADRLGSSELDRLLFPGGERHVYLTLLVGAGPPADSEEFSPELVLDGGGRVEPIDLAAAVRAAEGRIPAYLDLFLRSLLPGAGERHSVAPTWTAAIFAYPEDAAERAVGAVVGERELRPEEIVKDELDVQILRAAVPREEGSR